MLCTALFKNKAFLLFLMSRAFAATAVMNCYSFIPILLQENIPGSNGYQASLIVSLLNVTNGVSRLLSGFRSKFFKNLTQGVVNCWCFFLMGVFSITMSFSYDFFSLALSAALFGLCQGPWNSQELIAALEVIENEYLSNACGIIYTQFGFFVTIAPPIFGMCHEFTGSSHFGFYGAAVCFFFGAVIGYISILVGRRGSVGTVAHTASSGRAGNQ